MDNAWIICRVRNERQGQWPWGCRGGKCNEIVSVKITYVGGGARSPLWLQLKADICGIPLRVPQVTEAACLGAALLGGIAAGVYRDPADAVAAAVHWQRRVEPDAAGQTAYDARYGLYREVYPLLAPLQHRL